MHDDARDHSTFSKSRDWLIEHDVCGMLSEQVLAQARMKRLMSAEHFSVEGTLIRPWASQKSLVPKDGSPPPSRGAPTTPSIGKVRPLNFAAPAAARLTGPGRLAGCHRGRRGGHRPSVPGPGPDAIPDVVDLRIAGLLREESTDRLRPVAAATDQYDRLPGLCYFPRPRQPCRRVGIALFVEKGQQMATGHDAGVVPFGRRPDVDHRDPGRDKSRQLGVSDIDDLGTRAKRKKQ